MLGKVILVIVILAVFAGLAVASLEFTCTAWFCNRCHEMNEYYDSWMNSSHSPEKNEAFHNCTPCHVQPGFLNFIKAKIGGVFSLLWHVSGHTHVVCTLPTVCIREGCHNLETIDAQTSKKVSTLQLDHKVHVEVMSKIGTRYQCMPCHKEVAHGALEYMPDMENTCFLCHTGRDISKENCDFCHPRHLPIKGDIPDLYPIHKEEDVQCVDCHLDAHKASAISCMNCHEDESILDGIEFDVVRVKP
ncbi:MAG: NapC/NirT family cytochrome c [bacterium]